MTLDASPATIDLAAAAGDGIVSQIELTCLGRVVAQAAGSPGSLSVSPSALAPGDNVITPVAVFSDGSQVAGGAFTVHVESGWVNAWTNAAGTALWSNPANWSGGTTQCTDGVARFSGAAAGTIWLDAPTNMQEIDFKNTGGGNYTIAAVAGQTLTLSSTNGPMSECLIEVSNGQHTISAPLSLASAGNLVAVNGTSDSLTITGGVSGPGGLTKTGSGTLTLTGNDTFSGAAVISGGTLQIGNGVSGTSVTNTGGVLDNSSLIFNQGNNAVFSAAISGNGTLTKIGTGTLTLTGTNTYSGGTVLNNGTLIIASAGALPDGGNLTIGSGTSLFLPIGTVIGSERTVPVPEPSTLGLIGTIAICTAAFSTKWRRTHA